MSSIYRSTRVEQTRLRRERRGRFARVVLAVLVLSLTYALARIQITAAEEFALVAQQNRMRALPVRAPRGTIYDRHGQVVTENVVGYQVLLMPAHPDTMRVKLAELQPVLELDDADLERAMRRWRRAAHLPMEVTNDASPASVARLQERRHRYPGVLVSEYPKRQYSAGASVAHIVGYVSEISEPQLASEEFEGYRQGRWIGQAGLERQYEKHLGGEPGVRYLEIDARGRIRQWLPDELGVPPIPGRDLHLHLDLDLQRYVAEVFKDADALFGRPVRGGFVALDPQTGGVLAYFSRPTFDPNLFTGGISTADWRQLNEDPAKPLLDRAGGDAQPPGSTFKLPVAALALHHGVIEPEEFMPIPCTGGMAYQGRYARCHYAAGHGRQNLILGIKNSCNVYFYQVGIRLGLRRMLEEGTRMGFGGRTGIDLPSEIASTYPRDLDWMQRRLGYRPYENEVMNLSIGQGLVTITPLKLAQLTAALARPDGTAPAPRFAVTEEDPPIVVDYGLTIEQVEHLRRGMRRVLSPGGTAYLTRLQGWDFMGKTGTAQNPRGDSHGWFVATGGPVDGPPEIVVAMIVEAGQSGSGISGLAANAANFYLSRKHGVPFVRYPTPRERYPRGLPVDQRWLSSEVVDYPTLQE